MLFTIKLCSGSDVVDTLELSTPYDNDFSTGSVLATFALFNREGVDSVVATRKGADDPFFYGEKY